MTTERSLNGLREFPPIVRWPGGNGKGGAVAGLAGQSGKKEGQGLAP